MPSRQATIACRPEPSQFMPERENTATAARIQSKAARPGGEAVGGTGAHAGYGTGPPGASAFFSDPRTSTPSCSRIFTKNSGSSSPAGIS